MQRALLTQAQQVVSASAYNNIRWRDSYGNINKIQRYYVQ